MTQLVGNPYPMFFDRRGRPLDGGKAYIGVAGQDPEAEPIDTFFDKDHTVAAPQPIAILGGLLSDDGNPALIFTENDQYSLRVRDADGAEVFYVANAAVGQLSYQPLDNDLSAIASLSTTPFGRLLLTQANAAAARQHLGVPNSLPLSGGQVTGAIIRQGAGAYGYAADPSYSSVRFFFTANGAADPRTQPGDIWFEAAP